MKAIVIIIGFIIFGPTIDTSKQGRNQSPVQQKQLVLNTKQKKDGIKPMHLMKHIGSIPKKQLFQLNINLLLIKL